MRFVRHFIKNENWKPTQLFSVSSMLPSNLLDTYRLQIHDELIFEVWANDEELKRVKDAVLRCCGDECVEELKLQVPLNLECSYGFTWGEMERI